MNKKVLESLFDTVGCKNVSKTDLLKDALVITRDLKTVLDKAGYTPGIYPKTKKIRLEIFGSGEVYTISYYASQREGSGRKEEYRTGLGELRHKLKIGEKIALARRGTKIYLAKLSEADLSAVEKDIEGIEAEQMTEGTQKKQLVNVYERNPAIRFKAIAIHGTKCKVCKFDFYKQYGEYGEGYIEVHHIVPLSKYGNTRKVDPEKDMTVLCSNCHRMIHRRKDSPLSVQKLKKIISG